MGYFGYRGGRQEGGGGKGKTSKYLVLYRVRSSCSKGMALREEKGSSNYAEIEVGHDGPPGQEWKKKRYRF